MGTGEQDKSLHVCRAFEFLFKGQGTNDQDKRKRKRFSGRRNGKGLKAEGHEADRNTWPWPWAGTTGEEPQVQVTRAEATKGHWTRQEKAAVERFLPSAVTRWASPFLLLNK